MLIPLYNRHLRALSPSSPEPFIARITESTEQAGEEIVPEILLVRGAPEALPAGYRGYFVYEGEVPERHDVYQLAPPMHYLAAGDVVRVDPGRGAVHALYRRSSPSNSFLVTERCDNYCLMCSQPPRKNDDGWLVDDLLQVIPLISPETMEIGLTGGEPALLGGRLVELVALCKEKLPSTALHILTNGRRFNDSSFARAIGRVRHPDLMLGIPLYSDLPEEHDYVVQARGAFTETIRGILNLKRHHVRVEIRFVVHAETYRRLPEFARFLARNLLFADHVALMGLELTGFAKTNLGSLWIDPIDYQTELSQAVEILEAAGMCVSIYNHPLCVLDGSLHGVARKSISDWKNLYFDECQDCDLRAECGGFFASSVVRRSRGIRAVRMLQRQTGEGD